MLSTQTLCPRVHTAAIGLFLLVIGCSSGKDQQAPGEACVPSEIRCSQNEFQVCADDGDSWITQQNCSASEQVCHTGLGCVDCFPDGKFCDGFTIRRCNPDGFGSQPLASCDPDVDDVCFSGECVNACELADRSRSYEGCEYWAVDLDNAVIADQGTAAAQQYSIVLSNASPLAASVTVEIFCTEADAADPGINCTPGAPYALREFTLAPNGLRIVDLDPREVDGSSSPELNDGPGTWRSMHAYHITSTAPLIAYQFNPLENVNVFSNDASLLLPTSALDDRYLVLSWPQTLATTPDPLTNGLIDLRAFLTIVGVEDDTDVSIGLTTGILGGGDIPAAQSGQTLELKLNKYEVLNLETDDFNSDFTGTVVRSFGKPIAVFTGSEASDAPRFESFLERDCCADHLEQQLFPETAFGTDFVAVKSPLRSKYVEAGGWDVSVVPDEPEFWRILATGEDTSITTNLPPPNNFFILQGGQSIIIKSERDFTIEASNAIAVAQVPGSQQTTGIPDTLQGGIRPPGGDPSLILLPPVQQWRERYLFLVPNKYAFDFLLIAAPTNANILYDSLPIADVLDCEFEPIGELTIDDVVTEYQALRCPLSAPTPGDDGLQDDGVHTLETTNGVPIGLVVYGWDSFVSYGYPGGTNVRRINLQ